MSKTFEIIKELVSKHEVKISAHGYDEEASMTKRHHTKLVHEGNYVAEVDVEILDTGEGWSPYLSLEDAQKLNDVRESLREGDLQRVARLARVFSLTPVSLQH